MVSVFGVCAVHIGGNLLAHFRIGLIKRFVFVAPSFNDLIDDRELAILIIRRAKETIFRLKKDDQFLALM